MLIFRYSLLCVSLFCEELVGGEAHDFTVTHYHKVAIILTCTFDKATLCEKNARINTFL